MESNRDSQIESDTDAGVNGTHWWWALASTGQLGWGMWSFRKGYAGDSRLMPVKAFGVASLFVGSAASASLAFLQASGIRKVFKLPLYPFDFPSFSFLYLKEEKKWKIQVEDLLEVGANIRTRLGIPSRTPNK